MFFHYHFFLSAFVETKFPLLSERFQKKKPQPLGLQTDTLKIIVCSSCLMYIVIEKKSWY